MSDIKKLGCCTLCDEEVFEITRRAPRESSFSREPLSVGRPLPGSRRDSLVLTNGSTMDLTFCANCRPTAENLPKIWRKCRASLAREGMNDYRERYTRELDSGTMTQLSLGQQWITGKFQLDLAKTIPLGVLNRQPWREVV
jgi:hypothetical protein